MEPELLCKEDTLDIWTYMIHSTISSLIPVYYIVHICIIISVSGLDVSKATEPTTLLVCKHTATDPGHNPVFSLTFITTNHIAGFLM